MADRTNRLYNLDLVDVDDCDEHGWPLLRLADVNPRRIIGFNEVASTALRADGVHFFLDDYQFERLWRYPQRYVRRLAEFDCVLTPDFSLYTDMPEPMQRWNVYRSRALGSFWQMCGLTVVPTLQWSDETSHAWVFDGLPGGTVAVSTVGVRNDPEATRLWVAGARAAALRVRPTRVIHYGEVIPGVDWGCPVEHHRNRVIERMEASHGR